MTEAHTCVGEHDDVVRIAMWSGPRNLSTALMRSFGNRADCVVWDEPFYAAYLAQTGLAHPMRDAILQHHETDAEAVIARILGPLDATTDGTAERTTRVRQHLFYQKHMTHHMLPAFDLTWMDGVRHAFLIRQPERVLASYAKKRASVTLEDIGFVQQVALFDRVAERTGQAPPVIDANDVRLDPEGVLRGLCAALGIAFDPAMLSWPAGRRADDGIWAAHWYGAVEASTGFAPPDDGMPTLPDDMLRVADAARPHYERLSAHRIVP